MPKKTFQPILFFLIFLGLSLGGPVRAAAEKFTYQAAERDGRGTLSFSAGPLQTMTSIPFNLAFYDSFGGRIVDARVACELTMPAMPMPENRPRIAPEGNRFRGEAVFTMAGAWRMTCRVTPSSGSTFRLSFDIPEVRLK